MKLDSRINPNSSIYDNNFSTTTKSKFNTIDQYNRSNSRNNSPSKERGAAGNSETNFNLKNCTMRSNIADPCQVNDETND